MKRLAASDTAGLLPYPQLSQSLRQTLQAKALGHTVVPERTVMPLGEYGTLLVMPATDGLIALTKLVTVHPQQRPSVQAEVWVIDAQTGQRLLWLDGATVTARRTAALSLLAAQCLAPRLEGPIGIVGSGVQAQSHLEAFHSLGLGPFYIVGRNPSRVAQLIEHAHSMGAAARAIPPEQLALCPIVVTATTSSQPVLPTPLSEHVFIAAVGAYRPDMAEVPAALVNKARVFVDTLEGAKAEAGDLLQAGIAWNQVTPLEHALDTPKPKGLVLFKSVGNALWDLAAAKLALHNLEGSQQ